MKTIRVYISGSVQGVFFRKFLEEKANSLWILTAQNLFCLRGTLNEPSFVFGVPTEEQVNFELVPDSTGSLWTHQNGLLLRIPIAVDELSEFPEGGTGGLPTRIYLLRQNHQTTRLTNNQGVSAVRKAGTKGIDEPTVSILTLWITHPMCISDG